MVLSVLLAVLSFLVFMSIHIYIFHFRAPKKRFRSLIYTLVFSILVFTALFFLCEKAGLGKGINKLIPLKLADLANGLFAYFFIYYFYLHLIVVFDRSVTPRMMMEIANSKDKRIRFEELKANYSLENKFKKELIDMDEMDRIKSRDGYYYNTAKGKSHARIMGFLRSFLHIGGHQ